MGSPADKAYLRKESVQQKLPKGRAKRKTKTNQTKKPHEETQENIQGLWGNYKRYRDDTQSLSRMKRKILPKKTLLVKHSINHTFQKLETEEENKANKGYEEMLKLI